MKKNRFPVMTVALAAAALLGITVWRAALENGAQLQDRSRHSLHPPVSASRVSRSPGNVPFSNQVFPPVRLLPVAYTTSHLDL